ncbi:MAG: glycosyltransferase family 4 protein [Acidobacteria bacterium]|nr:glycosyltransferase family 4 protein [Acidobacteriota bacterium]
MRIVHVVTHLRLGAGRAIVDLCTEQAKRGHTVLVALSTDAEGPWASDPAQVAELERRGIVTQVVGDTFHRDTAGLGRAADGLRALVGAWSPGDVAHAHTAVAGAVAHWSGAPAIVVTCHGWNLERPAAYDLQDALAMSTAKAVISPSTDWAQRVAALPGVPHVYVIPNGFDLSRYPARTAARAGSRDTRIICVGEITMRKGQDLLVAAMPLVWEQCPGATLDLAGDGDMAAELRALASRTDPTGQRIRLLGHVARPWDILLSADVFCLPSRSDNQPVAIVEAMLAGLPIVSTRVGGIPEMIEKANAGEVVDLDSPDAQTEASVDTLAAALVRAITRDDRVEMGAAVEAAARREYGVETMVDRLEAIHADACRTSPQVPYDG